jgi:hypothetical protein
MSKDDVRREDEIACDDDTEDEIDVDDPLGATEPPEPGATLQAAIAWIMTRDAELTFALAEYELERMERLIDWAELTPTMSVEEAWIKLRAAVCAGSVELWGQPFEVSKDFEIGHVWPRGSQRRLTAVDVSDLCLIDRRGMALRSKGMIKAGQIWYCRISMSMEQLQLVFPPAGARILRVNKQPRDHKSQAAREIFKEIYPDESARKGVSQDRQLERVNEALKLKGKEPISKSTLKRWALELTGPKR